MIYQHKWTDAEVALLGSVPDPVLAKKMGVALHTVNGKRRRLEIPAFYPAIPWNDDHIGMLGALSDGEVARRTGRTRMAVITKRRAMGIQAAFEPSKPNPHWDKIEQEYRAGNTNAVHLGEKYGVHANKIRTRAKEIWMARVCP